jgi:hypothetical protein
MKKESAVYIIHANDEKYRIRVNTSTEVGKIKLRKEDNTKLDLWAGRLGIVG